MPLSRWYAVHTQPNAEAKASFHLRNQGFVTYLPCYLKRVRHARQVRERARPLFPRYLFLAMDIAAARWRSIRSTIGVVELVSQGEAPSRVPDRVIAEIRAREDARGLVLLPQVPGFGRGERVHINHGALTGQTGIFECPGDEDRVIVLLELLGRQVRIRLPAEAIAAA
ncbi:MAG: transcriptional activator RfaH [Alphaproteobacteria bacterium]|nr:transcriptional activator RfaH [Alphaproteobacteria bacterium]